ncbi:MAG: rhomboid family intramembrane serine protease [Planctomycetaceae bacterium]|nr:rhomboid family intramembrane serine protease [Planctomycetaceae bacterium]
MAARFDTASSGGLMFPSLTPVVKWLLIVNLGLFLALYFARMASPDLAAGVVQVLGLNPWSWFAAPLFFPFWQFATYGFLHDATGFSHILWNCLQLYFFGTMLEGLLGSRRFASLYGAGVLVAGLASLPLGLLLGTGPVIGASGAILAVVVALAVLQPNTPVILLFVPVPLKWLAIGIVAIDAFGLLGEFTGRSQGIAHGAHLAGAVFGFFAARRHWIWIDPIEQLEKRRRRREVDKRQDDERRLDALLGRIHREGIDSLDDAEREFLKRMSKRP